MWILVEIKRFFIFFYEEFFLFKIKNLKTRSDVTNRTKLLYKKNKIIRHNPLLNIELDKKFYNFYDIEIHKNKPLYTNSILFYLIKKNKTEIFKNLVVIFNKMYNFQLKIGLELEFYIIDNKNNINILDGLKNVLGDLIYNIDYEKGNNQFEIKVVPYYDIIKLNEDYEKILKLTKNFCNKNCLKLLMGGLPFDNDCGNALQINLSLEKNGDNLFSRKIVGKSFIESDIMLNCVAGLLKNINNELLLYIKGELCLKRFDLDKNVKLKNNKKYPAPTFICWGINNRSTAIRIPTPPVIDLRNYNELNDKNRRIEFRIPSADANLELVLIGVITSIIEGIENNLYPYVEKTSFDVLEKNSEFEKIETNFNKLNEIFMINSDILFF